MTAKSASKPGRLEPVLKASEVARHFGVTPDTVYGLIRGGKLRVVRVGRMIRIPQSAVADYIAGVSDAE